MSTKLTLALSILLPYLAPRPADSWKWEDPVGALGKLVPFSHPAMRDAAVGSACKRLRSLYRIPNKKWSEGALESSAPEVLGEVRIAFSHFGVTDAQVLAAFNAEVPEVGTPDTRKADSDLAKSTESTVALNPVARREAAAKGKA